MGKRFASFYHCLAFAGFWKVKFWRSFIKRQYFNDGWTDFHKNIHLYIFILGFFRKPDKLGSHTGSEWWPGDPDVKDDPNDPLTRWPNDPVTCMAAIGVPGALKTGAHRTERRQRHVNYFYKTVISYLARPTAAAGGLCVLLLFLTYFCIICL